MYRTALVASALLVTASLAWSGGARVDPIDSAIAQALSDRDDHRAMGVETLRTYGQEGLDALLRAEAEGQFDASRAAWETAIDEVAAQRDASWSGLFWHTDLKQAKQQAAETGKPILSLRMLGDLRDSDSCANSRFFRTVLYANPELADEMREQFVLHWSSEREVPRIRIDFGDGRVLERTITGNSAHYVLDATGRPLDVIPGLMDPDTFDEQLLAGAALHDRMLSHPERASTLLQRFHEEARDAGLERLAIKGDFGTPVLTSVVLGRHVPELESVPAVRAIPIAIGKGMVEAPLAGAFLQKDGSVRPVEPSDLQARRAELAPESIAHMASLQPELDPDGPAFQGMVYTFTRTVGLDATYNEDVLHTRVHDWFAQDGETDFDALNARVYSQLFETPAGDPWLGLHDPNVFTALPGAGVTE